MGQLLAIQGSGIRAGAAGIRGRLEDKMQGQFPAALQDVPLPRISISGHGIPPGVSGADRGGERWL